MLYSGRLDKKNDKNRQFDLDNEEDQLELLRLIASGESLTKQPTSRPGYRPILKHPLPPSDHRNHHLKNLRDVQATRIENQASAAISRGDSWVLEEVYMRGAPIDAKDKNGFAPIHLACHMGQHECLMILLNIGVDVNAPTLLRYTPLYISRASGSGVCENILLERGALLEIDDSDRPPQSILDNEAEFETTLTKLESSVGLPSRFTYS